MTDSCIHTLHQKAAGIIGVYLDLVYNLTYYSALELHLRDMLFCFFIIIGT